MNIILLSFVGKQDPFSPDNGEEGSIVTLLKELSANNTKIKNAILLYTQGTYIEAELTRDWLKENYSCERIILVSVDEKLSDDPVNLTLAIREAKKALKLAQKLQEKGDILAFNFNQAYSQVNKHQDKVMKNLANELGLLRQKHILSLLQEVYFKASIKLQQKEYADFLVWLVAFQENLLKYLLIQKLSPKIISFNKKWRDIEIELIDKIKIFDQGKLYEIITTKYSSISYLNIPIMMRIVSYIKKDEQELLNKIKSIDRYVQERHLYIHEITGVNDIYNPEALEKSMFKILQLLTKMPNKNPFDILNKIILINLNTIANQL